MLDIGCLVFDPVAAQKTLLIVSQGPELFLLSELFFMFDYEMQFDGLA